MVCLKGTALEGSIPEKAARRGIARFPQLTSSKTRIGSGSTYFSVNDKGNSMVSTQGFQPALTWPRKLPYASKHTSAKRCRHQCISRLHPFLSRSFWVFCRCSIVAMTHFYSSSDPSGERCWHEQVVLLPTVAGRRCYKPTLLSPAHISLRRDRCNNANALPLPVSTASTKAKAVPAKGSLIDV